MFCIQKYKERVWKSFVRHQNFNKIAGKGLRTISRTPERLLPRLIEHMKAYIFVPVASSCTGAGGGGGATRRTDTPPRKESCVPEVAEKMNFKRYNDQDSSEEKVGATCFNYHNTDADKYERKMLLTPQRLSELREHSAILAVCYRNRRRLQDDDLQELARMFSCEIMYSNASCLELIKRLTGGTLYEGTQIFSGIPYFEITSTNTMLPCLETLYLWNTLAAQSDDDLLAICMLELIEEARQYIYYNDLPTGISQQTKKASLDFIRGCCLQRLGKRGQAMKCFRNISSLERNEMAFNDIEDDFLILIALLEEALYYYDQGVEVTAQLIISYVLNVYDNMSRGARTFCIAFAKIMKVNLRFPG
ncbi:uncharacterized protein LOC106717153 [Papilio machaon]|uniref:uncharacterized protein LOC106717153 n=1 Tax=Papilio machaon TaxID=76193 RepID=UPI001E664444|nr:uncharacterized protein LOC106717153 [Papilio machaon]